MHTVQKDESLHEIRAFLKTFRWLSPNNLEGEKARFFRRKTYNPQLSYPELPLDKMLKYQKVLNNIKIFFH